MNDDRKNARNARSAAPRAPPGVSTTRSKCPPSNSKTDDGRETAMDGAGDKPAAPENAPGAGGGASVSRLTETDSCSRPSLSLKASARGRLG
eukprot:tig00000133_g7688.t1